MLRAVMKREKDGAALVTCEHNKCKYRSTWTSQALTDSSRQC
jgi:hypothetical protein